MTGSSVSAVTAYTAHREWASRPPDERYASVHALYEAARARAPRIEERTIETGDFRTEAVDTDDLVVTRDVGSHRRSDALEFRPARDHRQRAAKLPSDAARDDCVQRNQLRAAAGSSRTASAVRRATPHRGPCTRSHHRAMHASIIDELAGRVLDLMAQHPAWHLPLGYKDGEFGAETGTVRRLPGRPRHVSVPRGRQPRSRRSHGPHPRRSVPRIHSPEQ